MDLGSRGLVGALKVAKYQTQKRSGAKAALLVLAGLMIGGINGVFGAGGGMLAVPALTYVTGLEAKEAHATAIALILPLCLIGTIAYSASAAFDPAVVIPTVIGVLIGGIAGAALMKKLSADSLKVLFYGLMLFAGLKMMI